MQAILSDLFHALNREPESMHALANSYLLSGDKKRAEQVQQAFKKGGSQGLLAWRVRDLQTRAAHGYVSPVEFASLYARLGNKDQSLQFLEQAYEQHSPMLLWVENDSDFDFLHNESRYRHLIHAMGLPEA